MLFMLPPEKQLEIAEGSNAFIDKLRKAGSLKEIYNMPGLKGNMSIFESESAEEGDRLWLQNPMYPFLDVEMYVLSDWDAFKKTQKGLFQQLLTKK